jgi:hypothetical protein
MFGLIVKKDIIEGIDDVHEVYEQLLKVGVKTLNDKEKIVESALWYHKNTGLLEKVKTKEQLKFAEENDEYQLLFLN